MNFKSVIAICLSIIIGFSILSFSTYFAIDNKAKTVSNVESENRYKFTKMTDGIFILTDLKTGQSWVGRSFDLPPLAADCPALKGNTSPN